MSYKHVPDHVTTECLLRRKNGSWRKVAVELGYAPGYGATLCDVAWGKAGCISREGEKILRARLGIKPRNRKRYHRPCLDDAEYARFLEWRQTCG